MTDQDTQTQTQDFQTQPFNRQAEEAVLGSVLINSETYYEIAQIVTPEDFYIIRHRWIWEAYQTLMEQQKPLDYLTVCDQLEQVQKLNDVGGEPFITALINQTPSAYHAVAYAHIISEAAIRRRMLLAANDLAKLAFDQNKQIDEVVEEAQKSIFSITEKRSRNDLTPINEVISDVYARVGELSMQSDEIYGVPTGLIDLDRLLGGLQKSDLLIVAGRPGSGKTGFLLSVAKNAAQKHRKNVAIFSLEMSSDQLVQRLVAQETGIDTQRLRTGKLNDDEWPLFTHAMDVLGDTHIFLDDTPAISPMQLITKCRRLESEYSLDLVIVDYIQLMTGDVRTDNRVQEVSTFSRSLKVLARDLKVPVLAAAQLSRAVEQRTDKRPMLSDLRESGSLEQDADVVMFIHRPDMLEKESAKKNVAEIIVAKHRNGPVHSGIELVFLNNLTRFENAATRGR